MHRTFIHAQSGRRSNNHNHGDIDRELDAFRPLGSGARGGAGAVALVLLLVGVGATSGCGGKAVAGASSSSSPAIAATSARASVIKITTAVAEEAEVVRSLSLTGTLLPNRKSEVAADAMGKVTATFVERGSFVKKGAPLVRLDQRSAAFGEQEAAIHQATIRTQNIQARTECARAQRLFDGGAINQAEFERSQTHCDAAAFSVVAAAVRVGQARKALADALVRAPFAGEIAERFVTEGEFVRPDTRVVSLVEIDNLRLELNVPEAAVAQISREQEVRFTVGAFPSETFRGRVRFVGASVRRSSRDLLVEAVVSNADRRLRPGMFATAQLTLGLHRQTVIPTSAVRQIAAEQPERIFVVASGGLVEERLVRTGARQGDRVVVVEGVRAGDRVITTPGDDVRDGARVE